MTRCHTSTLGVRREVNFRGREEEGPEEGRDEEGRQGEGEEVTPSPCVLSGGVAGSRGSAAPLAVVRDEALGVRRDGGDGWSSPETTQGR
jgi:hypothetical protein